jgi:large subunit ribosomal protein L21
MFAVVEVLGKQFRIQQDDKILIPSVKNAVGTKVKLDKILLLAGDKEVKVGNPIVPGATVEATVVEHVKGDKLFVFKKKKRKGYRVRRGHRQSYTEVQITKIGT